MREQIQEFWDRTLTESRQLAVAPVATPAETPVEAFRVLDVQFSGYGGEPIRGWLILPPGDGPHPVVVEYLGLGGGRGRPHEHLFWAACGFAHFVMDSRGQGSGWRAGETPDSGPCGVGGDQHFTRGLASPEEYYYRRFFTDAVLAVDAVATRPEIDADRIAVAGVSQGGGTALVVASLREDVRAVVADVPAFGAFPLAIELAEQGPYQAIAHFLSLHHALVDQAFATLEFFDVANLVDRAQAPALVAIGGRDDLVPPESIRQALVGYRGPIEVVEYRFNGHEGGQATHDLLKAAWVRRHLAEGGAA